MKDIKNLASMMINKYKFKKSKIEKNMNGKEKAEMLVAKFKKFAESHDVLDVFDANEQKRNAQDCCHILCDEMIDTFNRYIQYEWGGKDLEEQVFYWMEVKGYIEVL